MKKINLFISCILLNLIPLLVLAGPIKSGDLMIKDQIGVRWLKARITDDPSKFAPNSRLLLNLEVASHCDYQYLVERNGKYIEFFNLLPNMVILGLGCDEELEYDVKVRVGRDRVDNKPVRRSIVVATNERHRLNPDGSIKHGQDYQINFTVTPKLVDNEQMMGWIQTITDLEIIRLQRNFKKSDYLDLISSGYKRQELTVGPQGTMVSTRTSADGAGIRIHIRSIEGNQWEDGKYTGEVQVSKSALKKAAWTVLLEVAKKMKTEKYKFTEDLLRIMVSDEMADFVTE